MSEDPLSSAVRIGDPHAAAALVDPFRRRVLFAFAGEGRSIAEVSGAHQWELKRLHYHVQALEKLGLLSVVGEVRRAGRPIKLYRTAASGWFVPARFTPRPSTEAGERLERALDLAYLKRKGGAFFYAAPDGSPRVRALEPDAPQPALIDASRTLKLTADGARKFAEALEDLIAAQGGGADDPDAQPFVLRVAFASDPS